MVVTKRREKTFAVLRQKRRTGKIESDKDLEIIATNQEFGYFMMKITRGGFCLSFPLLWILFIIMTRS